MRLTASGLARAKRCPPSTVLPRAERPPGAAAERGSAFHHFAARALVAGVAEALAEVPKDAEHRALCEALGDPMDLLVDW